MKKRIESRSREVVVYAMPPARRSVLVLTASVEREAIVLSVAEVLTKDVIYLYALECRPHGSARFSELPGVADPLRCVLPLSDFEPGAEVRFRASAIANTGSGSLCSEEVGVAVPAAPPDPPACINSFNVKKTNLSLRWPKPLNARGAEVTSYRVQREVETLGAPAVELLYEGSARECKLTDLKPGSVSRVCVAAANSAGFGRWSALQSFEAKSGAPGACGAVAVSVRGATALQISWAAPLDNGGSSIQSYRLDVDLLDGKGLTTVYNGDGASAELQGLEPGTGYELRYRATNSVGVGPFSSGSVATGFRACAAVVAKSIKMVASASSLAVTWGEPSDIGGALPESYRVDLAEKTRKGWSPLAVVDVSERSARFEQLQPGVEYRATLQSCNAAGWSKPSTAKAVRTLAAAPSAATDLRVVRGTVLVWRAGAGNGADVANFSVGMSGPHSAEFEPPAPTWVEVQRPELDFADRTLEPGRAYQFFVVCVSAAGSSPPAGCGFNSPSVCPAAPSVTASQVKKDSFMLAYAAGMDGGSPIVAFEAQYRAAAAINWTDVTLADQGFQFQEKFEKLLAATEYAVRVRAVNSVGKGSWSETSTSTVARVPDAPPRLALQLSGTDPWDQSLHVSWQAPPNSGGSNVSAFEVEMDDGFAGGFESIYRPTEAGSLEIGDLLPGCTYRLRCACSNQQGSSKSSPCSTVRTAAAKPDQTPNLIVTPGSVAVKNNEQQLRVGYYFTQSDTNGSAVETLLLHVIEVGEKGQAHESAHDLDGACSGSVKLSGLTPGTAYEISGRLGNAAGEGKPCETACCTTRQLAPPVVLLKGVAPTSLELQWKPQDRSLQLVIISDGKRSIAVEANCNTITADGLSPCSAYSFCLFDGVAEGPVTQFCTDEVASDEAGEDAGNSPEPEPISTQRAETQRWLLPLLALAVAAIAAAIAKALS